jgi:hypothetical protein
MFRHLAVISLLSIVGLSIPARAAAQCCLDRAAWAKFHDEDMRKWSIRSDLPGKTIKTILSPIDGDDPDENQYLIQRIDTRSLASRGQIFVALTDFGTSHWLSVWIVNARPPYEDVWYTSSIQKSGACPEVDLGTESILGEATASATKDGQLLTDVPEKQDENNKGWNPKTQLLVATYIWAHNKYQLKREEVFTSYGWNGNDYVTHGPGMPPKCAQSPVN